VLCLCQIVHHPLKALLIGVAILAEPEDDVAGHPGGLLGFGKIDLAVQARPNAITSY
jgi:hypothetical protein